MDHVSKISVEGSAVTDTEQQQLLAQAAAGDPAARTCLFTTLYAQLHRIAKGALQRNGPQLELSAATLLHEAYLDIAARTGLNFASEAQFMAYAARAMRGLIIDYARESKAQKRGAGFAITALSTNMDGPAPDTDLARLSEALDALALEDAMLAELVDLKFFCGFSFGQIAVLRNVSERTVQRDWSRARAYLHTVLFSD